VSERVEPASTRARRRRLTHLLLVLTPAAFLGALVAAWIAMPEVRESKSLWVLFLYCFPSEFVIATVPHEPVLLYFSKFYDPWTVAGVSSVGTVLTEWMNYSVVAYVSDRAIFRKAIEGRTVAKLIGWFHRAPFAALWVAGITPVPFYPFRFLAVVGKYRAWKYLLAVFLSRTPRFWIICVAGAALGFADWMIVAFALVLAAVGLAPATRLLWRRRARSLVAGEEGGS
jgi:membrane protein YqaA with SNARE-associated domain